MLWPAGQPPSGDAATLREALPTRPIVGTPSSGQVDAGRAPAADTPTRFSVELAELIETAGGAAPAPSAAWAEALAFEPGAPRLAVAHYDALQAARTEPATAPLRIVATLGLDEVLFVTRADSPLSYLHEIAGRRLDAGPIDGARALTAATVYEHLFGAGPPLLAGTARSEEAALQRLAQGSADVVVVVGTQTLDDFAARSPEAVQGLKLLRLDRRYAANARALRAYLPVTLRAAEHPGWLEQDTEALATMAFLVTTARVDEAEAAFVGRLARVLCTRLPQLQRTGDPQWREVAPALRLPVGWPYSASATRAFKACADPSPRPSRATTRPKGVRS